MTLLLLLACTDGDKVPPGEGTSPDLSFPVGRVIDPKLEGAQLWIEDAGCPEPPPIVLRSGNQTRTLHGSVWDGTDDDGVPFDPGPVELSASCDGAATETLWVVRLGVAAVDFTSASGDTDVPLAFHKRGLLDAGVVEIVGAEYRQAPADALSPVDDDAGAPRPAIAPWADTMVPPWGDGEPEDLAANVPAAYVAGATPRLEVTAAATAISALSGAPVPAFGPPPAADAPPVEAPTIRLVVDGVAADWAPGEPVTLDLAPVEATLGRETRTITWSWEAAGPDDTWIPIPGTFATEHTLWRTAGPAQLRDGYALGFAPATTWIGVLADTEAALTGVEPEPAAVLDALRDHIHESDWIIYDPNDGSYSSYSGSYIYWDYTWSNLSSWLDRDDGIRLYCHSVSCLLSTLAGHVGVYAPQQVLGVGFTTNLVRAAGTDEWLTWGFNSHSLVSPDDGATLWDASIAMDGDEDPGREPVTEVAPKGLSFAEYTRMLSDDRVEIVNSGLCYFE